MTYDVVVIGGGHAGCEAARAAAVMGARTLLLTHDMARLALMSCNPAIGGIAKGQIVREVDALGGFMGLCADATALQKRMLNRSKGPAMWSPRAQCDRDRYTALWRQELQHTPGLDIWQDEATEITAPPSPPKGGGLPAMRSSGQSTQRSTGQTRVSVSLPPLGGPGGAVAVAPLLVRTLWGVEIEAAAVVVTAGTFLRGLLHIGPEHHPGGRIAEPSADRLTASLEALGHTAARMKTGTPVRLDARSIDFTLLERQDGEHFQNLFSFLQQKPPYSARQRGKDNSATPPPCDGQRPSSTTLPCWTTTTNAACHALLNAALPLSPLYNGQIQSTGPRYCPSIETKLHTFPGRDSHPLFLEPLGTDTTEMYLNGFSSSMPIDVQIAALRQIPAFRNVKAFRPGYAIEYDYFSPTLLHHTLESRRVPGLYLAGQVNGTTGYEEAAGQGLVAGINAALRAGAMGSSQAPRELTLRRDEAYIGVLIDDLTVKGVDEPYRMFTSRAEYRILLRQDNADARLTPLGHSLGLATAERYSQWQEKEAEISRLTEWLHSTTVRPDDINPYLRSVGSAEITGATHLAELLRRPGVTIEGLERRFPTCVTGAARFQRAANDSSNVAAWKAATPVTQVGNLRSSVGNLRSTAAEAVEIAIKYEGYIRREREHAEGMRRLESIKLLDTLDYSALHGLSTEARQKLAARRPHTLAEASRIPGVSPSDVNALLVLLGR